MIRLDEARLTDAVPASLAEQPWARALAYAEWMLRGEVLHYADRSQIYTALDTCPEEVLDALAVCWKVSWYDTAYPLSTKRQIIKSSVAVRRFMGTKWATQEALRSVWPDSDVEEWFDYEGEPGCFRVVCNITDPSVTAGIDTVHDNVMQYKRTSAHLDSISFMVRRGIKIGKRVDGWAARVPECGTLRCGTWWTRSTLGHSERPGVQIGAAPDAYNANQPECGTLPEMAARGWQTQAGITLWTEADAYAAGGDEAGVTQAGRLPQAATLGIAREQKIRAAADTGAWQTDAEAAGKADSGTLPQQAVLGVSRTETLRMGGGTAAEGYVATPAHSGQFRCGAVGK